MLKKEIGEYIRRWKVLLSWWINKVDIKNGYPTKCNLQIQCTLPQWSNPESKRQGRSVFFYMWVLGFNTSIHMLKICMNTLVRYWVGYERNQGGEAFPREGKLNIVLWGDLTGGLNREGVKERGKGGHGRDKQHWRLFEKSKQNTET